jgi:radical SAM/Cys-rich protein
MISSPPTSSFQNSIQKHLNGKPFNRQKVEILQVNIGKRCNQACHHCHVESSPIRTENMTEPTIRRILELLHQNTSIQVLDITGGAPELNPHFRLLVQEAHKKQIHILDRCNLTVLFEPGQEDLADFLAHHHVEIVASLPCYLSDNVEKQRGKGVYSKSIQALKLLNTKGYAQPHSPLKLNLVYNPLGATLPPPQAKLEKAYKERLFQDHQILFNHLITITNMPIKRFKEQLQRDSQLDSYLQLLVKHFNPATLDAVMCKNLLSIGWDGQLYDCDFNQMLDIPLGNSLKTLWDIDSFESLSPQEIATDSHCFGCTAGAGSSCSGSLL